MVKSARIFGPLAAAWKESAALRLPLKAAKTTSLPGDLVTPTGIEPVFQP